MNTFLTVILWLMGLSMLFSAFFFYCCMRLGAQSEQYWDYDDPQGNPAAPEQD